MIQTNTTTVTKKVHIDDVLTVKSEVLSITDMKEEDWFALMFDKGCLFAERFCKQFPHPEFSYNQLTKVKNENGAAINFFWSWWRFKWVLNDKEWLIREAYTECILVEYSRWKNNMVEDYLLEKELLEDLDTKSI